ncbi:Surfeit locus 1 cytochrome c oxidase biogenesis protein isoform 1 [Dorcoceras hygrometricum]|uniref:SURF1-like protein n=1 Tax=Dorcoceras hygrometricum TaxID=472368 RepID=A0A2Z7AIY6_9LAMI|nr:Surfeit locus 1 cytochrome c oxidase biogenesis protein isoform 1 [Dorcoceras hygrometricum]
MAALRNLRCRVGPAVSFKWAPHLSLYSTSAAAVSVHNVEQEKKGRSTWSKLFLFIPGAITFGLGTWQIFRRQEKIKMLEFRQSRLGIEPLKGNQILPSIGNPDSLEFRRIQCRGGFDDKKSIYVGPRSRSISGVTENGYYVITPLIPVRGDLESLQSPVLVNRGWVPRSWRDKALDVLEDDTLSNSSSTPSKEIAKISWWQFWSSKPKSVEGHDAAVITVQVLGVIRGSEKPSIFVPPNDPSTSQWFYVDVPAIAQACGLPEKTLYIEAINDNIKASSPYPVPKDANALIRIVLIPVSVSTCDSIYGIGFTDLKMLSGADCTTGPPLQMTRICISQTAGTLPELHRHAAVSKPPLHFQILPERCPSGGVTLFPTQHPPPPPDFLRFPGAPAYCPRGDGTFPVGCGPEGDGLEGNAHKGAQCGTPVMEE